MLQPVKVLAVQGLDCLTMEMTPLRSFETSVSPVQSTRRNISEDLDLQRRSAFECKVLRRKFEQMIDPLKTKRRLLYLKTQFVPRSKHFSSRL